jgi:hypothetical protein
MRWPGHRHCHCWESNAADPSLIKSLYWMSYPSPTPRKKKKEKLKSWFDGNVSLFVCLSVCLSVCLTLSSVWCKIECCLSHIFYNACQNQKSGFVSYPIWINYHPNDAAVTFIGVDLSTEYLHSSLTVDSYVTIFKIHYRFPVTWLSDIRVCRNSPFRPPSKI